MRWAVLFVVALLALLTLAPAHAAVPTAEHGGVLAWVRYEVDPGDGEMEYEIPIDLLAFASDADGDHLEFSVDRTPLPEGATLAELGDGLVLFRMGVAALGALTESASFSYTVTDPTLATATATVTVSQPQNIFLPSADVFEVAIDRPTTLPVLGNDPGAETIVAVTQGTLDDTAEPRGLVELNAPTDATALIFTPAPDYAPGETHKFSYTPSGPNGTGPATQVTVIGVASADPVLQVIRNWDSVVVAEGDTVPFPAPVVKDQPDSVRFNLSNPTGEIIEITNADTAVSGECFSVIEAIPGQVHPDSNPDPLNPNPGFRVRVQCPTSGIKTATVTLEARSASGVIYRPFTFTLTAAVIGPPTPLVVLQRWDQVQVTEGAVIPYPSDPLFYVPTSIGFDLYNPTTEAIQITNVATAVSGTGFSITPGEPIPDSVAPGATVGFRLRLYWDAPDTLTGTVTLQTQSASDVYQSFSFSVTATLQRPELDVFRGWPGGDPAEIVGGETVELPTLATAGDPNHSAAFQISNARGDGTLVVLNPDASIVSGECFSIRAGGFPDEQVPAGGTTPFRVWWGGTCGPGTYTAVVRVETNALPTPDPLDDGEVKQFTVVGRVAEIPVLTCQPADARVTAGGTATFSVCTIADNGTLTYAWFKDGVALPETGPSLTLNAVGDADEGLYHVEVGNELGTTVSQSASLTVVNLPVVSQPLDQTVPSGSPATFSVTVSSPAEDGPFSYVWQQLPPGAPTFQTIAGETGSTLTLAAVTLAMDGTKVRCVVSNEAGQTNSGPALLSVLEAPTITQQPQSQRVTAGSDVTFTVTVTGSGTPTYLWKKDGVSLGVTTATFPLTAVADSDEGVYTVTVTNSEGTVDSNGASLTVVEKPVVSQPLDQAVPTGSPATFSVTVSSPAEDGPFNYVWQQLPPGASTFQTIAGENGTTLTLAAVTVAMDGTQYRCLVSNEAGQTNSGAGLLSVLELPAITQQPQSQRVVAGSNVSFSVTATGSPAPTYAWRKNGVLLGVTTPTLSLSAVTDAEEGLYKVRVTNSEGWVDSNGATLTVVNKPVVSRPLNQSAPVGGSATFSVTVSSPSEDGPFTYQWQQQPPGATTYQTIAGATSASYTVGNVTLAMSGTRYRCLVNNDAGQTNSLYGALTVVTGDVQVAQAWNGVVVGEGATFDFGTAERSVSKSYQFKITNVGQATLTLSNPTAFVSGTCWSQIENAASSVAPGASTYFRVRLLCGTTGTKSGTITINSNDPSTPYRFYVRGTVVASDATVYRDWDNVLQSAGTTYTFPNTETGVSVSRRFRITNTGQATLTISNPTSLVSGTCWSQIENAASTVAPGASTWFRVRLLCSTAGTKTGTITIHSNDPSSPYVFYVQGTVTAPAPGDVTVYRDWNSVLQGEGTTYPFPDTTTGTAVSRRFRITNTGSGTLTISNPTSLVSGTCWSQIENAASSVAPGASTWFRVRLLCSTTGTKTGTITINSNDTSSPYRFYVQGTVN